MVSLKQNQAIFRNALHNACKPSQGYFRTPRHLFVCLHDNGTVFLWGIGQTNGHLVICLDCICPLSFVFDYTKAHGWEGGGGGVALVMSIFKLQVK